MDDPVVMHQPVAFHPRDLIRPVRAGVYPCQPDDDLGEDVIALLLFETADRAVLNIAIRDKTAIAVVAHLLTVLYRHGPRQLVDDVVGKLIADLQRSIARDEN